MYLFKCTAFLDHPHPCKYAANASYKGLLMCCHSCEKYEKCKDRCKNMVHRCGKAEVERVERPPIKKTAVIQYDMQGNKLGEYDSIKEAAAATGVHRTNISNASNGRIKDAGGCLWRRKHE